MIRIRRALLSAYHKEGLLPLAQEIVRHGGTLVSSGGTAAHLRESGLSVTDVGAITGFGSLFGGRVKTLHPKVHGGILFRRDDAGDVRAAEEAGIEPIDLVVVNLYPFGDALRRGAPDPEAIELIDIGGPAMVRAAAKNHAFVGVVTRPQDYEPVRRALAAGAGALEPWFCRRLAATAFRVTAEYDAAIAGYLERAADAEGVGAASGAAGGAGPATAAGASVAAQRQPERIGAGVGEPSRAAGLPDVFRVEAPLRRSLRYGENPSQAGALYGAGGAFPFDLEQLHGKELSFNNLLDLSCGRDLLAEFPGELVAVVIKHGIPCGVARGASLAEAYRRARDADSLSAFGGVVLLGREVDPETAELLNESFLEVVLAPDFSDDAIDRLRKKKNRVLLRCPIESLCGALAAPRGRFAGTGFLLQTPMPPGLGEDGWRVVTKRAPTSAESEDLRFGWKVLKHVRSNGVLFAKEGRTVGVGSGQCSRIDSVETAIRKAEREGHDLRGSVMVSDAFFPFRDSVDRAAEAGTTAVLQPGGSVRDEESIAACDEHGMAMVCNDARVFSHG